MNKAELITAVGEKAELSHTDATKAVEAVLEPVSYTHLTLPTNSLV